jgi:UPF0042 nucleotide-binding protein
MARRAHTPAGGRRRAKARGGRRGRQHPAAFVVVSGLSGAGKSHAIRALEDQGYLCVDNLPIALLETFADLTLNAPDSPRPAAVVIDVREGRDLEQFPVVYRRLQTESGQRVRMIFLEASDGALVRRFSETRRPHPLAKSRSVSDALTDERRLLLPLRRLADKVLDTSNLTVHELRRVIRETTGGTEAQTPLVVTFLSFGFRRGVPTDADLVFDVRFLPNPHFVEALRPYTGRHSRVAGYVLRTAEAKRFIQLTSTLLEFLVPQYIAEGKAYLTIAIGCTGGRHRSVALAETFAKKLRGTRGIQIRVKHRDEGDA